MRSLRRKISKWKRHTSVQESSGGDSIFSDSELTASNKSVITVPRAVKTSKEDDDTTSKLQLTIPEEGIPAVVPLTCLVRNDLLHLDTFFGELPSPKELKGFVTSLESNSQHITHTKRLERALQRLNESLKEFEQTYDAQHIGEVVVHKWDDESISMLMQEVTPGGLFGVAVGFGNAITETVAQKTELDGVDKRKRSILIGFVGKLLPLIKVLLVVGDAAAQVRQALYQDVTFVGFRVHSCSSCFTRVTTHNGGKANMLEKLILGRYIGSKLSQNPLLNLGVDLLSG
jgi:hypothetical protein